jgi:predicted MFS family arabinose efflux permease
MQTYFCYVGFLFFMPQFLSEFSTSTAYGIMLLQQVSGAPGVFLGMYLQKTKLGRKGTGCFGALISSACYLLFYFIDDSISVRTKQKIIVSCLAYMMMFTSYGPFFSMVPDSFPTDVRSSATSLAYVFCRIGGTSAPPITGALLEVAGGKGICVVLFGVMYAIAGILMLTLNDSNEKSKITEESLI